MLNHSWKCGFYAILCAKDIVETNFAQVNRQSGRHPDNTMSLTLWGGHKISSYQAAASFDFFLDLVNFEAAKGVNFVLYKKRRILLQEKLLWINHNSL